MHSAHHPRTASCKATGASVQCSNHTSDSGEKQICAFILPACGSGTAHQFKSPCNIQFNGIAAVQLLLFKTFYPRLKCEVTTGTFHSDIQQRLDCYAESHLQASFCAALKQLPACLSSFFIPPSYQQGAYMSLLSICSAGYQ